MQTIEKVIDSWSVFYQGPQGDKYGGKLTVTNLHLLYDLNCNSTIGGKIKNPLLVHWGSESYLVIPKNKIAHIRTQKTLFAKKILLTLTDGSVHIFNYRKLNTHRIIRAIQFQN
jgi:hypothetical protein